MSLDAPKSDAELLDLHRKRTSNGVALGPRSPLNDDAPRPAHRARKGMGRNRRKEEHAMQCALFEKIRDVGEVLHRPALALVFAVPNGASASSLAAAAQRKAEGQTRGVPDIWCPVARGGYHGLVIELKTETGRLSSEQADWLHGLAREGWRTAIHTSVLGAWAELRAYLDLPGASGR